MEILRPAGRTLGAGKHQHLVLERDAAELVPRFHHLAGARVDAAPARHGLARHQGFPLADAADHLAPPQNDRAHCSPPFQRPVTAASTQSATEPNQDCTPVMAGR